MSNAIYYVGSGLLVIAVLVGCWYLANTIIPRSEIDKIDSVVRCKDCKWRGSIGCAITIADDSDKPKDDDFCSWGERE